MCRVEGFGFRVYKPFLEGLNQALRMIITGLRGFPRLARGFLGIHYSVLGVWHMGSSLNQGAFWGPFHKGAGLHLGTLI